MKIVFFTEGEWVGTVSRTHPNLRTDLAWQVALKSAHWPLEWLRIGKVPADEFGRPREQYLDIDIGIIILPKNGVMSFEHQVQIAKRHCKKVAVMQEGPNWYWQDYPPRKQADYFNALQEADFILCHSGMDRNYYRGLLNREDVFSMPALMIEDLGFPEPKSFEERSGVMVGGNMTSWYGGFDSMVIAHEFNEPIAVPSMGRKQPGEEALWPEVNYLGYMSWLDWINKLNNYRYGVHLMRTFAAGTFALNCARLGIPCIGWNEMETQNTFFPDLSPNLGDMATARKMAIKLRDDSDFYNYCVQIASNELVGCSESLFVKNMKAIFHSQLNTTVN